MTLTPSARGRSSEFRNDHDLYVSSALSSPCADVNLLDVGHPMFNSEASLKHLVRHQRIRTSGNLSKRPAGTREQRWCVLPMWMTWWTFWMVLVCITAILAVSLVNILSTKNLLDLEHKESVLGLAQVYASETSRQLRSSGSSLQALEAFLKVDAQHLALRSFDGLAHPLISTYQGITSLGLAPHGRVERVYPAGPFHVQNLSILLHPDLAAPAMKAMQRGEVQMSTWTPDGHDRAIMICRPIFTSYAPPVFQDGLMVDVNDTRHCSNTSSGVPACFWGFAIMMSTFDDLLRTVEFSNLATGVHRVAGYSNFDYHLL
ncbi:unnamed protein product [Durusdinium trenchii]|uniref:CHASE domain-containing protein n=1 Tax=Durusdinium trenchii TaxID=1381693 RepID=A0ABP0PF65_9DINO